MINKHLQKNHLRKPLLASKFIPPPERSRIPAMTNAPSAAGMAKSIRRPRIVLKTCDVCIGTSSHHLTLLTLRDEVFDESQNALTQIPSSSHRRRQPAAAAPPLQHSSDDSDASACRADHVAHPIHEIQECACRVRRGLTLYCLAGAGAVRLSPEVNIQDPWRTGGCAYNVSFEHDLKIHLLPPGRRT